MNHSLVGKKFYVATAVENRDAAVALISALQKIGMEVTFVWSVVEVSEYPEYSRKEIEGVCDADILIVLLPGKFGTQTEVGAAIATKRVLPSHRIIAYAANDDLFTMKRSSDTQPISIFWHHPFVERVIGANAIESIVEYLEKTT